MTLAEAKSLPKGAEVEWREGSWICSGKLKGVYQTTVFHNMTFEDIATFDPTAGKKCWEANIEYIDDDGKVRETYVNIKALHLRR